MCGRGFSAMWQIMWSKEPLSICPVYSVRLSAACVVLQHWLDEKQSSEPFIDEMYHVALKGERHECAINGNAQMDNASPKSTHLIDGVEWCHPNGRRVWAPQMEQAP